MGIETLEAHIEFKRVRSPLGRHLIAELHKCDPKKLSNINIVKEILLNAARDANMKIVKYNFHHFKPYGVSGMVIVAESHLSIHTWPEHGYAAVDIYVCGENADPWKAYRTIIKGLRAKNVTAIEITRGIIEDGEALEGDNER